MNELNQNENKPNWHPQEVFKGMIAIAISALKCVLLVNGGAAIAFLTFLGHLPQSKIKCIPLIFFFFLVGVFFAALAYFFAYLTQLNLFEESINNNFNGKHVCWLHTTIAVGLAGIICFLIGSSIGVCAISQI